jgi:histidine phosphotransferase ChpT
MSAPDVSDLDAVSVSALMSSRICHDLINPVGALSSGLEVLADPSMDASMKDAAIDLIRTSAERAVALLKYARLAYGAAGGRGAELPLDEARDALIALFAGSKCQLDWRIAPGQAPKDEVKALLVFALSASDSVPRGGVVTVEGSAGAYVVTASGARLYLNEELMRAVAGDVADMKPKFAPHYLAGIAARRTGGEVTAALEAEKAVFRLRFERPKAVLLTGS